MPRLYCNFVIKIHIHTDCSYFAGCENMLPPLIAKLESDSGYECTFSFRKTQKYLDGLEKRIHKKTGSYPRRYPVFKDLVVVWPWFPKNLNWISLRIWLVIGVHFAFIYEAIDLYLLMRKLQPAVLHVNNGGYPAAPSARAAIIAGRLARVPVIIMVVNNMAQDYNNLYRILDYPIDRLVARFTTSFVSGSTSAMNQLSKVLRLPESKTKVIPNGIMATDALAKENLDASSRDLNGGQVKFCIIAELVPRKGHIYLLQAIVQLRDLGVINPQIFKLQIVGEGENAQELETFVTRNNLGNLVFFEGYIDSVYSFLKSIDVVVLPSIENEDFPYVVMEGMSMGKPIIGSKLAGIPEQIDHLGEGILVSPRSSKDLAEAINTLLENPELRRTMGIAGRERYLKCFTAEIAVENYLSLYSTALSSSR